jgi:cupin fold WbuC family metalloprotein
MNMIEIIDLAMLDTLSSEAGQSPRLRKNLNFHRSLQAACNRLLNGMEPDSYIRPHRHLDEEKDESVVILRGRLGVIAFDDDGCIMQKTLLVPGGEAVAVNVPCGVFHTFVSLEKGTVFFEAKAGPYRPISDAESAPWAPAEGSADANTYFENLKKLWRK